MFIFKYWQLSDEPNIMFDTNISNFNVKSKDKPIPSLPADDISQLKQAYALCRLQKEGIKSCDIKLQEQISEFTFEYYPFIFQISKMARWYLKKYLIHKYDNAYIFIRCSLGKGKAFDFEECINKWNLNAEDDIGLRWEGFCLPKNINYGKEIFNKLKKRNKHLIITLPDDTKLNISLTANINEETSKRLNLVYHMDKFFYQVFSKMGNKSAKNPYYKIEIKEINNDIIIPIV